MIEHRCAPPPEPGVAKMWRCPRCQTRYVWAERMLNKSMVRGWNRMFDDMDTIRRRNRLGYRRALIIAVILAVVAIVAFGMFVAWIVHQVT